MLLNLVLCFLLLFSVFFEEDFLDVFCLVRVQVLNDIIVNIMADSRGSLRLFHSDLIVILTRVMAYVILRIRT